MMEYKEEDVVLCTVKKIEGTAVFLDIEGGGEGSMILSEVAAGRIRNLREYVSPGRKIVCKILSIKKGHIELSLRRVTTREREEVLDRHKKESALRNILKSLGEDSEKVLAKIKSENDLSEFLDSVVDQPELWRKYIEKKNFEKVASAFSEKTSKEKFLERKCSLKTNSEEGLEDIKKVLALKNVCINYLGSSVFSIKIKGKNFKEMESEIEEILKKLESDCKEKGIEFEKIKDKK